MELQSFMTTQVVSLAPDQTITDAAKAMQKHNIGFIPVCNEDKRLVGILTDRDIVTRTVANHMDTNTATIADVMTRDVIFAEPQTQVDDAATMMAHHQIRRLPIVQSGQLLGVVTLGDLATRVPDASKLHVLSEISEPSKPMNV